MGIPGVNGGKVEKTMQTIYELQLIHFIQLSTSPLNSR